MVTILFTIGAMAQAEQTTTGNKQKTSDNAGSECYEMKDNMLMHCWGEKSEVQKTNVTLKNGTKVSTKGEVTMADGKTQMLTNGQCIDIKGMIGDCNKMHVDMKHDKMNNTAGDHKDQ